MVINILIMIGLGVATNSLATLRTIFTSKKARNPVYFLTFLDAVMFGTVLKQISVDESLLLVGAYAVGRVIGYILGDLIEDRIALGNNEIEMSLNHFDKMVEIADNLRDLGYSVETSSTFGYRGKRRYKIVITAQRKKTKEIIKIIQEHGYESPTLKIKELQKIEGKFIVSEDQNI